MSSPGHARTSCAVTPKTSNGSYHQLLHALAGVPAISPTLAFSHPYNPQGRHLYSFLLMKEAAGAAPRVQHGGYVGTHHQELHQEGQPEPLPREDLARHARSHAPLVCEVENDTHEEHDGERREEAADVHYSGR